MDQLSQTYKNLLDAISNPGLNFNLNPTEATAWMSINIPQETNYVITFSCFGI